MRREMKCSNQGGNGSLSGIQKIPYLLIIVLAAVYLLGMTTAYGRKGDIAAQSLTLSYTYDADIMREVDSIKAVQNNLDKLLAVSKNKKKALDASLLFSNLEGAEAVCAAVEDGILLIDKVANEDPDAYRKSGVKRENLTGKLMDLSKCLQTFLTDTNASLKKIKEKKLFASAARQMEKTIKDIEAFCQIEAKGDDLVAKGNLALLREDFVNLEEQFTSFEKLLHNSIDSISKAEKQVSDKELVSSLGTFKAKLSDARKSGSDAFCKLMKTDEVKGLQNDLEAALKELEEDAVRAENDANNLSIRKRLSYDIAENSSKAAGLKEGTYILKENPLLGSLSTSDGVTIWSALPDNKLDSYAWSNLTGESFCKSSRQILGSYKEEILPDISYTPVLGFRMKTDSELPANLTLTIRADLQEKMYRYLVENGIAGEVLAYNYETGEILCMASSNKGWTYSMRADSPGSTMKMVTAVLLEAEGVNLEQCYYTCTGKWNSISCTSGNQNLPHGKINGTQAIGVSCNCWFAQAIHQHLMKNGIVKESVKETLRDLGYLVQDDDSDSSGKKTVSIGKMKRSRSQIHLLSSDPFSTYWNLIGQTTLMMSPIDMVQLAGLYANGGSTPKAKLIAEEETKMLNLKKAYGDEFKRSLKTWKKAYSMKYGSTYKELTSDITVAKTGTTQISADGDIRRTLLGISETKKVAFYIIFNNSVVDGKPGTEKDVSIATIANYLFMCQ